MQRFWLNLKWFFYILFTYGKALPMSMTPEQLKKLQTLATEIAAAAQEETRADVMLATDQQAADNRAAQYNDDLAALQAAYTVDVKNLDVAVEADSLAQTQAAQATQDAIAALVAYAANPG